MSVELVLFFAFAALAVGGAVNLIVQRQPIHSALSLIVVMVALAAEYLLLGAEFIAAIQIIVYAGAIMVLFVLVIMLLNAGEEERTNLSRVARWLGVPMGTLLMVLLAYWMLRGTKEAVSAGPPASTRELAITLFREFVLPFELTAILILVAILGAMVLAGKKAEA